MYIKAENTSQISCTHLEIQTLTLITAYIFFQYFQHLCLSEAAMGLQMMEIPTYIYDTSSTFLFRNSLRKTLVKHNQGIEKLILYN